MCLRALGWFCSGGRSSLRPRAFRRDSEGCGEDCPLGLPGASCDCGSQRLLALCELHAGGLPWNHMMFGLNGQAKECFFHPSLTIEYKQWQVGPSRDCSGPLRVSGQWKKRWISEPGPLGLLTLSERTFREGWWETLGAFVYVIFLNPLYRWNWRWWCWLKEEAGRGRGRTNISQFG